jgi:hypothetical protein
LKIGSLSITAVTCAFHVFLHGCDNRSWDDYLIDAVAAPIFLGRLSVGLNGKQLEAWLLDSNLPNSRKRKIDGEWFLRAL